MLLIQIVLSSWDKKQRGAPYAAERSHRPKSYVLPEDFFKCKKDNPLFYPKHIIGTRNAIGHISTNPKSDRIELNAIEVIKQNDSYEIRYRFDFLHSYNSAIPKRRKYNSQFDAYEPLNEVAFQLSRNEYGRIIHNAKYYPYYGDGNCWYEMSIINLLYLENDLAPLDILVERTPDKIYKQMAMLY